MSKMIKNKSGVRLAVIIMHIVLTFFLERIIFIFSWDNIAFRTTIPRNYYIGDKAELELVYALSKVFAIVIIALLWRLIFAICDGIIDLKLLRLFGIIFILGLIVGIFLYPDSFGLEVDNWGTYSLAIRFLPTYWHSIYTGAFYAGCLMVLPHPIGIFIVQWALFVCLIASIFSYASELNCEGRIKYYIFAVFLLPETYELIFNPYRNNLYTILCVFYFFRMFLYYKGDLIISGAGLVEIALLSAFIMVWRSEGILIGLGGILFLLMLIFNSNRKYVITLCLVSVCGFLLLNSIQGLGAKKYYGKDYLIVSTTNILYSILNDPEADIEYDDLQAVEAVVPALAIKESGISGYRDYNYTMGRLDGNQTLASDEMDSNYLNAFYRITLNNFDDYLRKQFGTFLYAVEYPFVDKSHVYEGQPTLQLQAYQDIRNTIGKEEVSSTFLSDTWGNNGVRKVVSDKLLGLYDIFQQLFSFAHIGVVYRMLAFLGIIRICTIELKGLKRNERSDLFGLFTSVIIILELLAIIASMPEGRAYYLYPMLYLSYLVIYFRTIEGSCK